MVLSSKGVLIITGCLTAHALLLSKEHSIESLKVDTVSVFKLTKFLFSFFFR